MKRTELKYRKKDSLVELLSYYNVATRQELYTELGYTLAQKYLQGTPCYFKSNSNELIIKLLSGTLIFHKNYTLAEYNFDAVVKKMKLAGARLGKLIKEKNQSKIHKILI